MGGFCFVVDREAGPGDAGADGVRRSDGDESNRGSEYRRKQSQLGPQGVCLRDSGAGWRGDAVAPQALRPMRVRGSDNKFGADWAWCGLEIHSAFNDTS